MHKRIFFYGLFLSLCAVFFAVPTIKIFGAEALPNLGFIKENIWYSKDPFQEGDKIKIYTIIFNPDPRELLGEVVFFDDTVLLGKKEFKVSGSSVKDVYIDWTVTSGTHKIFAKIENSKFLVSKGKYEEIYIKSNETSKSTRTVLKSLGTLDVPSLKDGVINTIDLAKEPVSNLQEKVRNNIPSFIAEPVLNTINTIDEARKSLALQTEKESMNAQNELDALNKETESIIKSETTGQTPINQGKNTLKKPLKYLEVFVLKVFSTIFQSKLLFYGICVFVIFLIARFIWNRFL